MSATRSSRISESTCGENKRNGAGNRAESSESQDESPAVRGSFTTVVAQAISSLRVSSFSASAIGSRGWATRSTGVRSASGTTPRINSDDVSASNPKQAERLKNCGLLEIPSTDLKPRPNRPISVPRFIGHVRTQECLDTPLVDRLALVRAVQRLVRKNHGYTSARSTDQRVGTVLDQLVELPVAVATLGGRPFDVRVFAYQGGFCPVGRRDSSRTRRADGGSRPRRSPSPSRRDRSTPPGADLEFEP